METRTGLEHFEADDLGYIVYKRIGAALTHKAPPDHWTIVPGAILREVVNPCRVSDCACGINFGTREWCADHYPDAALWRCRIRWAWLPDRSE